MACLVRSGRLCPIPELRASVVKVVKSFDTPTVSGIDAILRNVLPYFIQVPLCPNAEDILLHAARLFRSRDFCRNRVRAAAESTVSPRSREFNRDPSSRLKAASCAERFRSCSSSNRRASRTTSLAEVYRPDSTFAATNLSSAGVSETFTGEILLLSMFIGITSFVNLCYL